MGRKPITFFTIHQFHHSFFFYTQEKKSNIIQTILNIANSSRLCDCWILLSEKFSVVRHKENHLWKLTFFLWFTTKTNIHVNVTSSNYINILCTCLNRFFRHFKAFSCDLPRRSILHAKTKCQKELTSSYRREEGFTLRHVFTGCLDTSFQRII